MSFSSPRPSPIRFRPPQATEESATDAIAKTKIARKTVSDPICRGTQPLTRHIRSNTKILKGQTLNLKISSFVIADTVFRGNLKRAMLGRGIFFDSDAGRSYQHYPALLVIVLPILQLRQTTTFTNHFIFCVRFPHCRAASRPKRKP